MKGNTKKIKDLILNNHHDPNVKMTDWYDSEALGWSASLGQLDATITLIELGADPLRPPNKGGNTPLKDA